MANLQPGDKLTILRNVDHGDWKTAMVHADRWPTLRPGDVVTFVEKWANFYGTWLKVTAPNGSRYDIRPIDAELVPNV